MNELSKLKYALIASIKKNGNQPLTLQHLVNIIAKMEDDADIIGERLDQARMQDYADQCGDRE